MMLTCSHYLIYSLLPLPRLAVIGRSTQTPEEEFEYARRNPQHFPLSSLLASDSPVCRHFLLTRVSSLAWMLQIHRPPTLLSSLLFLHVPQPS
jgi:hypothetical protein